MIQINETSIGRMYTLSNDVVVKIIKKSNYKTVLYNFYEVEIMIESPHSSFRKGAIFLLRSNGLMKNYNVYIKELYLIPLKEKLKLL